MGIYFDIGKLVFEFKRNGVISHIREQMGYKSRIAIIVLSMVLAVSVKGAKPEIYVDVIRPGHSISPMLYGLFFEDINYAADGGLYAELIMNRSFEFEESLFSWDKIGEGSVIVGDAKPLNDNNTHYVSLSVKNLDQVSGIVNRGFNGIAVKKDEELAFSVYLRGHEGFDGALFVSIKAKDGESIGLSKISDIGSEWKKYSASIKVLKDERMAKLAFVLKGKGSVDADMISLFPEKTWKGQSNGLRADIVQMLVDLKPSFIRFPGGCIVEGKSLDNAYRWKDSIGDVAERKINWNRWSGDSKPAHYYQSYGLGYFEYFRLCDDIGAEPVPVLNCGMSCQFQDAQLVPLQDIGPWVQDALDLIEYANGPLDSEWGAKRAKAGHPEPFGLKYIGIGNEQWGEQYFERYEAFYKAIKQKHPEITIITSSGPGSEGHWFSMAWNKFEVMPAEIVDEHYYNPPEWFLQNANRYNSYDRNGPAVFVGEYAAHNERRNSDLYSALTEAAFMTGLERNSDIVVMASYAPLLAKIGSSQWSPDLIWFDNSDVYGTPSYYVQKLFGVYKGDKSLSTSVTDQESNSLPSGRVGLRTWSTKVEYKDFKVVSGSDTLLVMKDGSDWDIRSGTWEFGDGKCIQTDLNFNNSLCYTGEYSWTDYTLTVKAKKIAGIEGFIIPFRRDRDGDGLQLNLGGWANTRHAIQYEESNGDNIIITEVPGKIEDGRWYDIEIETNGTFVRCKLDGEVVLERDIPVRKSDRLYASSSIDTKSGNVYIKVVNPTEEEITAVLNIRGGRDFVGKGKAIVLKSEGRGDENSIDEPLKVSPKEIPIDFKPEYTFEPYSMTVLSFHKQ